ncbi:MAG: chromate transporter [Bacteroidaceae bacterium]
MKQEKSVVSLLDLGMIFAKIGAFTIGGGYAMIPLIEDEVVTKHHYLTAEEFLDLLAVAQSTPGVMAANIAIFIGAKLRGLKGSLVATMGAVLPSFCIILTIALFFQNFREYEVVDHIFKGIRPGVVALIAVPTFNMGRRIHLGWTTAWIPVVSALLIWAWDVSPIYIIICAAVGGIAYGWIGGRAK